MNPIVINGTVLCDNITGIPRYVYENVVRLDKLIEGTGLDVRIAYRDDGRPIHLPELKNIRLVPLKSIPYFYNLAVLPAYLRRTHAFYVGLASDMLLTRRSVVVLHDIRPLVLDTDKGFFRFKFWVHCLSTKWFAQRVFTVSDNQRHLISEKLGIPLDKIGITYNGWEHMKNVTPDESIFDKMPGIKKGSTSTPSAVWQSIKTSSGSERSPAAAPTKRLSSRAARTCVPLATTPRRRTPTMCSTRAMCPMPRTPR